jgi:TetR/AcrR family transcriptional regulator
MPTHKATIRRENERTILAAAEEIFAQFGFKGATTALIAARAGVPKANLHYYFPTKEQLYRKVLEDICGAWMDAATAFDLCDDPREALPSYIEAKMALARTRPHGSKVWANEIIQGAPILRNYLEATLKPWFEHHARRIDTWIERGDINPIDPHTLLYMIWATTQHYADFSYQIQALSGSGALSSERIENSGRQVAEIILRGIGAIEPDTPRKPAESPARARNQAPS